MTNLSARVMSSTDGVTPRGLWKIPLGVIAATFVVSVGRYINVRLYEDFLQHREGVFDSTPELQHHIEAALGTLGPILIAWFWPRIATWLALVGSCLVVSIASLAMGGSLAPTMGGSWLPLSGGLVYGAYTFLLVLPVFQDVRAIRLSSKLSGAMAVGSAALYSFWAVTVPAVVYIAQGKQWIAAVAFALALPLFALYVRGIRQAKLEPRRELKSLGLRTLHLPFLFFSGEITAMYAIMASSG
jgi:hypothetical protein